MAVSEPGRIVGTYTPEPRDGSAARAFHIRRVMAAGGVEAFDRQSALMVLGLIAGLCVLAYASGNLQLGIAGGLGLGLGVVLQAVAQNLRQARVSRVESLDSPPDRGTREIVADTSGVTLSAGATRLHFGPGAVRDVLTDETLIIVRAVSGEAILAPRRAFGSAEAAEAFIAAAKGFASVKAKG